MQGVSITGTSSMLRPTIGTFNAIQLFGQVRVLE